MKNITEVQRREVVARYASEQSASIIAAELGLSLSQVYDALKKAGVTRRSPAMQSKIRLKNTPLSFNFLEDRSPKAELLLTSALMLYLGEGAKTRNTVDFANSDPQILKVFIKFLREICRVNESKLRIYLYCFADQDVGSLQDFWAKQLGINKKQFTKPYIRDIHNGNDYSRRMPCGVVHIRYNDKRLLEKILSLCSDTVTKLVF